MVTHPQSFKPSVSDATEAAITGAQAADGAAPDEHPDPLPDAFRDQLAVLAQLAALYHEGIIPDAVLDAWRQHVADNKSEGVLDCPNGVCNRVELVLPDRRRRLLQEAIEVFFRQNPVRVADSLGGHLRAVFFTGPRVNTIVLSAAVRADPIDMTFQVIEIFMHYMNGHLRGGTYDFLLELRRDKPIPSRFLTSRYGEFEGKTRRVACCLWDDAYSESVLDPALMRTALRQPGVSTSLIRVVIGNKPYFRAGVLQYLLKTPLVSVLRSHIHAPPLYHGPVAVVKAPDSVDINVYLLQRIKQPGDSKAAVYRRWIPSESVLQHLGLALDDVIRIPWEQIAQFEEADILIDSREVESIREILEKTVVYSLSNLFRNAKSRLRGILQYDHQAASRDVPFEAPPPQQGAVLPLRITPLCRL
jgi:hypothetical protein